MALLSALKVAKDMPNPVVDHTYRNSKTGIKAIPSASYKKTGAWTSTGGVSSSAYELIFDKLLSSNLVVEGDLMLL